MSVRKATLKDLKCILELERRYFGPPREDFRSLIELKTPNEECVFFVAEENEKIIGYSRMHLFRWYEGAHIVTIVVDENYRRKGYGKMLMKEMEDYAKNKGMKVLTLDTVPDNSEALIFYIKNGYKICGYKENLNGKSTVYLSKKL